MSPARPARILAGALFCASVAVAASGGESVPPPQEPASSTPQSKEDDAASRYEESVEVEGELPAIPAWNLTSFKSPLPVRSTPASVSVVPRLLFESQDAFVLGDALRNVSGTNVATGFGIFDYFVIRGFDSLTSGLVLTDGAPEPESTFYPLYNVRQVEVMKGPAAFLYGGNPLSGAVHLVRKQPMSRRFADVSASYGAFETFEGTIDANASRPDGRLAFRLNGVYRDAAGYRDDKDSSLLGVNPALVWRPDAESRVALNLEYVKSEFQPDTGIPPAGLSTFGVPRQRSYQSPFDVSEQDIYRLRLDVERKIGERLTLRDKVYYTDLDWRSDGTLLTGLLPNMVGTADVVRSFVLLDDRQKLFGNQAEALLTFSTGPVAHTLLVGVELSRLADDYVQDVAVLPNLELVNPVETARQPLPVLPGFTMRGDTRSFVVAPYVVERASFSDSFQVFAGARVDALDYEDDANDVARDDTKLSPMGGIVFSPTRDLSLYANAGSAFGPPSSQVIGDRAPEESWQAEVGVKRSFLGGRAFASLALYHLEKSNIAIPDQGGVLRRQGDQRSRGLEVEATVEAARNVFAAASYAYNDAELTRFTQQVVTGFDFTTFQPTFSTLDRSGNTPAFAPRHVVNAWVMKQLGPVGLGIGGRYVSAQFIAEDNEHAIDDYVTVDAMASVKTGRVKWSLNLRNLTDTEYETRGFGAVSVIPADPIALYGKIELSLGGR